MNERGFVSKTNKQKQKPEQNKTQVIGWQSILENRWIGQLALSFMVGVRVEESRGVFGYGAT